MRNKKIKFILLVLLIGILVFSFFLGKIIPWKEQIAMYDALRQTSILIFGLIGAWFAVLLPFALEKGDRLKHFFSFSKKLFPALSSAIYLLIITLIVPFSVNIAQNILQVSKEINIFFCGISLVVITIGLLLLFWGLIMILASFDVLKKDIELTEAGSKLTKDSKPLSKKTSAKKD